MFGVQYVYIYIYICILYTYIYKYASTISNQSNRSFATSLFAPFSNAHRRLPLPQHLNDLTKGQSSNLLAFAWKNSEKDHGICFIFLPFVLFKCSPPNPRASNFDLENDPNYEQRADAKAPSLIWASHHLPPAYDPEICCGDGLNIKKDRNLVVKMVCSSLNVYVSKIYVYIYIKT